MADLQNRRIFVVEDDVANMAVYATVLKAAGALVIQDPWNSNTLNMLLQFLPVDVILLDLMLRRGISGYEILAQIRSRPELAGIPVVAVSASDPGIEIPKTQEKGFAGFISKPIVLSDFPGQIASCIEGRPVWDMGR
jgi:CheY-like chemotaxis protein